MPKLLLIVNPAAGKGQVRQVLFDLLTMLSQADYTVTLCMTRQRGDAPDMAEKNAQGHDAVMCIGGDGTLSEVIAGLMRLPPERRPALGYIPMGTANDVAGTLHLSRDPRQAMQQFLEGKPFPVDIGRLEGNTFEYVAAFGAFTDVSYSTPQEQKKVLGHLAYVLSGLAQLGNIRTVRTRVEYEGGALEGDFVFGGVTNSTSVGGLVKLDPEKVRLNDGLLEVILIRQPQTAQDLGNVISCFVNQTYDAPCVTFIQTPWVQFSFDEPVDWTRDGENGGSYTRARAEICPSAIRYII